MTSANTPIPDMHRLGVMYTSGIAGTLCESVCWVSRKEDMKLIGIAKSNKDTLSLIEIVRKYLTVSFCIWCLIGLILIAFEEIIEFGFWDIIGFLGFCVQCCIGSYFMVYRLKPVSTVAYFRNGLILSLYNLVVLEGIYFFFGIKITEDSLTMLFIPYLVVIFTLLYISLRAVHMLLWKFEPTIIYRRYSGPSGYKFLLNGLFTLVLVIGTNSLVLLLYISRLDYLGL